MSNYRPLFIAFYLLGFIGCMVVDHAPPQQEAPVLPSGSGSIAEKGKHVATRQPGKPVVSAAPPANPTPNFPAEGWTLSSSSPYKFVGWVRLHYALSGLLFVVFVQTVERFRVHVVDDEPFPDWRKK